MNEKTTTTNSNQIKIRQRHTRSTNSVTKTHSYASNKTKQQQKNDRHLFFLTLFAVEYRSGWSWVEVSYSYRSTAISYSLQFNSGQWIIYFYLMCGSGRCVCIRITSNPNGRRPHMQIASTLDNSVWFLSLCLCYSHKKLLYFEPTMAMLFNSVWMRLLNIVSMFFVVIVSFDLECGTILIGH